MKTCIICNQQKPFDQFYLHHTKRDGHRSECKLCRSAQERARRANFASRTTIEIPPAKVCPCCREEKVAAQYQHDRSREDGLGFFCRVCVAVKDREDHARDPVLHRLKIMLIGARRRAKEASLPFDLSLDYLYQTFGHLTHCPVLGTRLDWERHAIGPTDRSPTLDKVVPAMGYTRGNVSLVSFKANAMKRDASADELRHFCAYHLERLAP